LEFELCAWFAGPRGFKLVVSVAKWWSTDLIPSRNRHRRMHLAGNHCAPTPAWDGVRPSPGAATFASSGGLGFPNLRDTLRLATPGDGQCHQDSTLLIPDDREEPSVSTLRDEFRGAKVPKERLKPCAIRQPSRRDLSFCGCWFPTLKHWAIIACPYGTEAWPFFAGRLWKQILVALPCPGTLQWHCKDAAATARLRTSDLRVYRLKP
jgi:hypothetical protein